MPRNCIYTAIVKTEPDFGSTRGSSFGARSYHSFLRRDGPTNNGFYSFGGNKHIRTEAKQGRHMLNPVFTDYDGV